MEPRLVAIEGPKKGSVFVLTDDSTTIGRESVSQIHLTEQSVSRRHCVIEKTEDGYVIRDVGSFNGFRINRVPVKERQLRHGDQIGIGDSVLIYQDQEDSVQSFHPVQLDEEKEVKHSVRIKREDTLFLKPEKLMAQPPSERLSRDLNVLLKISTTISSLRRVENLVRELFAMIFEAVPAENGAIFLGSDKAGADLDDFTSVFGWDRTQGADRPVKVSKTILRQVRRDSVAILSNDVLGGAAFDEVQSLFTYKIRSLLAVPIAAHEKLQGIIYLSTSDPAARFDQGHLELVTAIAGMAAIALENARYVEWLESENLRLVEEINIAHNMVGDSPKMREIYQFISRVAPAESTVLIRGESGTGKELAARALHMNSSRSSKPFVAINCATLQENLLESELFGHERGAFSGAVTQKKGKLEVGEGGTLFLDEIGEMSPLLQAKMLRVLQEREFERLGGTQTIKANIRLIAATNRDLESMIKQNSFRQDLYFRLNVVSFEMPPLRERREDIPELARYFCELVASKSGRKIEGITPEAGDLLMGYDWPGNVRELENAIERAVVLGSTEFVRPEDLPEAIHEGARSWDRVQRGVHYHDAVTEFKKQLVLDALNEADGNITEAARLLGIHGNNLHRLIRNLNLRNEIKK